MIVETNQSHMDLTVLGYGNEGAFFEIADINLEHQPTNQDPWIEKELPFDFSVGSNLTIDKDSLKYNSDQKKVIDKSPFKCATKYGNV